MRSKLLAHWTGKSLQPAAGELTDHSRAEYVGRLRDILLNGFWMTKPLETLMGGTPKGGSSSLSYEIPMTCFTEVRLTRSRAHSKRYGRLAVVVDRQFVLDRWGGPVHYVRNNADEVVVSNFILLRKWFIALSEDPATNKALKHLSENRSRLYHLFSMLKGMSDPGKDNYEFLDEHEWRVPFSSGQLQAGRILAMAESEKGPMFKIILLPEDVRMIVFPDAETRVMAMKDKAIVTWLSGIAKAPPLLTISECEEM